MQTVLEQGSIDKPLTFDVGSVSYQSVHLIHAIFQSNCAEDLHFSAFHSTGVSESVCVSVCLSVCLCVCVCVFPILAPRAIRRTNSSISDFSAIRA